MECVTIAATNRDLKERVQNKLFREDLFYRLSSFTLQIPSLCERRDDIPGLVRFYLEKYNKKYDRSTHIGSRTIAQLQDYSFPGNVRELKSLIENVVVLSEDSKVDAFLLTSIGSDKHPLSPALHRQPSSTGIDLAATLNEVEKHLLVEAKQHCKTTRQMSTYLNICQSTVVRKLQKHDL